MATELESQVSFEAVVDSDSLRSARQKVEDELGDIEVSVDAVAQTGGPSGSRGRGGQRRGPGTILQTNSYLDDLDDLAIERNDLLRELIDETELGNRSGGRGTLGSLGGGLLGLIGLGAGAGALGLSGLADSLDGFDPSFPDGIPLVDVPDGVPLTGVPDGLPVIDVPDGIPVIDIPDPLAVDLPVPIPVERPGEISVGRPAPVRDPVSDPAPDPRTDPSPDYVVPDQDPDGVGPPEPSPQPTPVPADDPVQDPTIRGRVVAGGADALLSGLDLADRAGRLGGTQQIPDWYMENAREAGDNLRSGQTVSGQERPTLGEAGYRLGGGAAFGVLGTGAAGLAGGRLAAGATAAALTGTAASGSAAAEEQSSEGNRSTTRREETNVTLEIDARESRRSRETIQEIRRKLPELERRLNNLEGAFGGRR